MMKALLFLLIASVAIAQESSSQSSSAQSSAGAESQSESFPEPAKPPGNGWTQGLGQDANKFVNDYLTGGAFVKPYYRPFNMFSHPHEMPSSKDIQTMLENKFGRLYPSFSAPFHPFIPLPQVGITEPFIPTLFNSPNHIGAPEGDAFGISQAWYPHRRNFVKPPSEHPFVNGPLQNLQNLKVSSAKPDLRDHEDSKEHRGYHHEYHRHRFSSESSLSQASGSGSSLSFSSASPLLSNSASWPYPQPAPVWYSMAAEAYNYPVGGGFYPAPALRAYDSPYYNQFLQQPPYYPIPQMQYVQPTGKIPSPPAPLPVGTNLDHDHPLLERPSAATATPGASSAPGESGVSQTAASSGG